MTATVEHGVTDRTPQEWPRIQLRRLATIRNGGTPTSEAENWHGDIPFVTPPDLRRHLGKVVTETERTLTLQGATSGSTLTKGGVALSTRAPIGYVARLMGRSAFNQGCRVLEPHGVDDRFLAYSLLSQVPTLRELGQGTTFMELSSGSLASLRITVPNLQLQITIADYLDRETAKIDALAQKQGKLIARLAERRQASIEKALTQNSTVSRVVPLSVACAEIVDCNHSTPDVDPDGYHRAVRTGSVRSGFYRPQYDLAVSSASYADRIRGARPRIGDVLFTREAPAGEACLVPMNDVLCLGQRMVLLRPDPRTLHPKYLLYSIYLRSTQDYFRLKMNGSTVGNVRLGAIRSLRISLPDVEEQNRIVDYLDREIARIDALITRSQRMIELSQERRGALIAEAVTGRIDVAKLDSVKDTA